MIGVLTTNKRMPTSGVIALLIVYPLWYHIKLYDGDLAVNEKFPEIIVNNK